MQPGWSFRLLRHPGKTSAHFDLDLMFGLTQIRATSKASRLTGVILIVTLAMDIDQQAAGLRKKVEKIKVKLDSPDLSANKRQQLEAQLDAITGQLKALEQQFTPLGVTKIKRTMHQ